MAGADEAGRGALAGPLVAAAVLFDLERLGTGEVRALGALDDSKKHGHAAREGLLDVIRAHATRIVVVTRGPAGLDRRGLHRTNLRALADALRAVAPLDAVRLSDGFPLPDLERPHRAVVGGDRTSAAIAAASIVAKVTRDRIMIAAAAEHPHWGFEVHKGYSCPPHRDAIREHGPSPIHRMSFRSVAYGQLSLDGG